MSQEAAETIGARALLFIAEEPRRLGRFLSETGLGPQDLRARGGEPETLVAALGHLMADEAALLSFAANAGLKPEDVAWAERMLGGGQAGAT